MSQSIDTILISHAHEDREYVEELVKLIKVTGVEENIKIICSSFPGHDIPGDVNIYDYLKKELSGSVWVIYVLSKNYYSSAACLNEMGATWVLNKKYSTFITPNFEFSKVKGAIDPAKNSFILNDKLKLNDFKNILRDKFNLSVSDNLWESVRDECLDKIETIAKLEREKSEMVKVDYETVNDYDENEITVVLRVQNNNVYAVDLTYFKVVLIDTTGSKFSVEEEPQDIRIHDKENKLFFRKYKLKDSSFLPARGEQGKVENLQYKKVYY